MRFFSKSFWAALVFSSLTVTAASYAHADTLLVTQSGTFSSSTPTSSFSAPNGTYSISFNVDSTPVVTASSDHFDLNYSNLNFLLNGAATTTPSTFISFYNNDSGGLFSVCFSTTCPVNANPTNGFSFLGNQLFSGTLSNPTILTGSYAVSSPIVVLSDNVYGLANVSNVNITRIAPTVAATPEPSSLMLLGTGILGIAGGIRRRIA